MRQRKRMVRRVNKPFSESQISQIISHIYRHVYIYIYTYIAAKIEIHIMFFFNNMFLSKLLKRFIFLKI